MLCYSLPSGDTVGEGMKEKLVGSQDLPQGLSVPSWTQCGSTDAFIYCEKNVFLLRNIMPLHVLILTTINVELCKYFPPYLYFPKCSSSGNKWIE